MSSERSSRAISSDDGRTKPHARAKEVASETPMEALSSMCVLLAVYLFVMAFIFQNFGIPSPSMMKTLLVGDHLMVDRVTLSPPTPWARFLPYRPVKRGDVIVFMKPHSEVPDMILVKRAIGIPGDRIHLRQGVVYVNGVAQKEPYAAMPNAEDYFSYRDDFPSNIAGLRKEASDDLASRVDCHDQACLNQAAIDERTIAWTDEMPSFIQGDDLVVPPGSVFAMGDNRTDSLDGRFWGFVPQGNILGRPLFNYWSFQTPDNQEDKTSSGDKISFLFHEAVHFFDETRWRRTFHVVR